MENQELTDLDLPMKIKLPEPDVSKKEGIEALFAKRRSIRKYTDKEFSESIISRFLWAAQGISSKQGLRTSPSAGAIYPLEIHIVAWKETGIEPGTYRYDPEEHALSQKIIGDLRNELSKAALSQTMIRNAPVSVVISISTPE